MKNINVSLKMVLSYMIMSLLSICICVVGVLGMQRLNDASASMYNEVVRATEYIGNIRENFQEQRVLVQELAVMEGDVEANLGAIVQQIEDNKEEMHRYLDEYDALILGNENAYNQEILTAENRAPFERFAELYTSFFEVEMDRIVATVGNINRTRLQSFITAPNADEMIGLMNIGYDFYTELSAENAAECNELFTRARTFLIIVTAIAFVVSEFFSIYLPVTIARPLRRMVDVADAVAVGDMDMPITDADRKDEVGRLANAFMRMKDEINKQITVLEAMANADLTLEPRLRSDRDTLGKSLLKLSQNLDNIISDVSIASDNVATESRQVANQSQELAQGTTEQAASVEQLSSAFFEISLNTKESASLAGKASELTDDVRTMAVEGESLMEHMTVAIKDADTASKSIDKIIKVIEDISFQTNILALNAAVEAAHAGQNGSGFAVVAAEVRSLASKSTASAKETSELIANALEKVQLSAEMASQSAASFQRIVEGIKESSKLITDIAKSSEEQAIAIEQINTGIEQVAQVIHLNSGAAEKCAAAAEKMSEQANVLEDAVSKFRTRTDVRGIARPAADGRPDAPPKNITIDLSPSIPEDGFGKY